MGSSFCVNFTETQSYGVTKYIFALFFWNTVDVLRTVGDVFYVSESLYWKTEKSLSLLTLSNNGVLQT